MAEYVDVKSPVKPVTLQTLRTLANKKGRFRDSARKALTQFERDRGTTFYTIELHEAANEVILVAQQ